MSIEKMFERYVESMPAGVSWYLIALTATAVFAVVWRIATTPRRPVTTDPLSATELAFLRSEVAPVVTVLTALRAGGQITTSGHLGRPARGAAADWFSEQVLRRVAADPRHTVADLVKAARPDLDGLEHQLSSRGLMRTQAELGRMRVGSVPAVMVTISGIVYAIYLLVHLVGGQRELTPALTVVIVSTLLYATVVLPALLVVNRLTREGRRVLTAQEKNLSYLDPAKRPAFGTYGPGAAAMSAALFGTGALWLLDRDYAAAVELAGDASSGGGASCGGSSCGDGGGGGGCGSGGGCGGCGGGCGG